MEREAALPVWLDDDCRVGFFRPGRRFQFLVFLDLLGEVGEHGNDALVLREARTVVEPYEDAVRAAGWPFRLL
jgi:hypothetical protein